MTTQAETLEPPEDTAKDPAKAPGKGASFTAGFLYSLGLYALLAWVAGIAVNKGYGVHVPFMAGWLLLLVTGWLVKHLATNVAGAWHHARVLADIDLMAAAMAAQQAVRQEQGDGLAGLLAKLGKTADEDTGAYL